ncbi:ankyrin repeat-containing domain protein [Radiomyces spectabilis]|uniref:ankyrin repeat-containing domain protein n=1 Tax=Radiomyces spectabilis TaxID=64574 RepID=UPI0022211442|nr:ankyrin repeat-containing domain protein [Radiomyces spectabilis]KAI8368298.1 ankyrin repeat-containing domain protein [Radiomyces spectabilis]
MADNQELLDDVIYCARYGELDDLKQNKPAPEYYIKGDESGNTALHMACANNHIEIVAWILGQLATIAGEQELSRYVNVVNEQGNSPLHWAALNGHLEVVEMLVKNGADCKIKNTAGKTPIYEAQQRSHEKVAEFFLQTMIDEQPEEDPMDEDEQYVEQGVPEPENK